MEGRVHPRDSSVDEENPNSNSIRSTSLESETPSSASRPILDRPPPETYVVQIPKDQIYRVPSSRTAAHYQNYIRSKPRRYGGCCCRCFCCLFAFTLILIILIGIAASVFFIDVRPKIPNYSVEILSIKGFNLTQSTTTNTFSPEFDVSVRADNPNKKIGFYYEPGSSVTIYHSNVELSSGTPPVFYQPTMNVTVFEVKMTGSVTLTSALGSTMEEEQSAGKIPLLLKIRVPAKLKIGSLKTWKFTVKVNCDIVVNNLSEDSRIVSKECDVGLKLW